MPGERYRVRVMLNAMAQALPPGHRLRLSLSTSYWPLAWPPPEPVRLTVYPGGSALVLPLRPDPGDDELPVPPLGEPEGARPMATTQVEPGRQRWTVTRDLVGYESALEVVKDLGVVRFDDIDLAVTRRADERYSWVADDVDSVRGETTWSMGFARGDWKVETGDAHGAELHRDRVPALRPAGRLRRRGAGARPELAVGHPARPRLTCAAGVPADRPGYAIRVAARTATRKLIDDHLVGGEPAVGEEIALRVDQTLTQDATGTLVMQELEAIGLDRARTDVSVQYVDHNLLQADERNAEDHEFLASAARRYGLWYSKPGNGVSHPTHMQRFGVPGATLAGSDSHTCAAGSLGMLAIGVGGLEVAMAIAGEPLHLRMPQVWGVRLTGRLPDWVSAKDVVLEMLRRHGVDGGVDRVIEYHGPGLARALGDGPARHRQHGRRARRHHDGVPRRRGRAGVPALRGARGRLPPAAPPTRARPTTSPTRSTSRAWNR